MLYKFLSALTIALCVTAISVDVADAAERVNFRSLSGDAAVSQSVRNALAAGRRYVERDGENATYLVSRIDLNDDGAAEVAVRVEHPKRCIDERCMFRVMEYDGYWRTVLVAMGREMLLQDPPRGKRYAQLIIDDETYVRSGAQYRPQSSLSGDYQESDDASFGDFQYVQPRSTQENSGDRLGRILSTFESDEPTASEEQAKRKSDTGDSSVPNTSDSQSGLQERTKRFQDLWR